MRKAFGVTLAATLAGGLAWATLGTGAVERVHTAATQGDAAGRAADGTARRAARTFDGRFRRNGPGTSIVIKAKFRNGEARAIRSMRYRANMQCPSNPTGTVPGEAGWTFRRVRVNDDRKFAVRGDNGQTPESRLVFKGKFNADFTRVRGTFRTRQWFEEEPPPNPLPAEYCTLARTKYAASR